MPPKPLLLAALLALAIAPRAARADDPARQAEEDPVSASTRELAKMARQGSYLRLFGAAMVGEGLRFNNPYRLSHQLGETGESLSLTAPYSDLSAGISFGPPDGLQHGLSFGWSEALSGVPQTVITPSYLALYRGPHRFMFWGRAGLPILLSPDANIGGEVALSMAYFFTSGIGAAASIIGSGYYGAGTWQVRAAFYPVLSGQLGMIVDYEVLP